MIFFKCQKILARNMNVAFVKKQFAVINVF